jgi:hypothetical protein
MNPPRTFSLSKKDYVDLREFQLKKFPHLTEETIEESLNLCSGRFDVASELLVSDFNLDALESDIRNYVFTIAEDLQLKRGQTVELLQIHNIEALRDRCMYLGLAFELHI